MVNNFMVLVRCYHAFYERFFSEQWNHMTPVKYGTLLIGVAIFGWVLMKSGNKRE